MGDLTKNFNRSEYACPHGVDLVHPDLAKGMQEYRDILGVPVKITSACRCDECGPNQAYHWASMNQDIPGRAADSIALGGKTLLDMYAAALQVEVFRNGGIGIYPYDNPLQGFLHLDVRSKAPGRWARVNGVYVKHQQGLNYIYEKLQAQGADVYLVDSLQSNGYTYKVPQIRA